MLTSVRAIESDIDWAGVTAVQRVLNGEQFGLSVITGQGPWATIAVPLFDQADKPIGALAAVLDLTDPDISPFEHPFDLGRTGTLDVVEANGMVLISTRPERVLTASDQADLPVHQGSQSHRDELRHLAARERPSD